MGLLGAKDGLERWYLHVCEEGSGEKELWTTMALFVATRGQGGVVGHFGMQLKVSCTHTHIYTDIKTWEPRHCPLGHGFTFKKKKKKVPLGTGDCQFMVAPWQL
jgi:hypothetical protein